MAHSYPRVHTPGKGGAHDGSGHRDSGNRTAVRAAGYQPAPLAAGPGRDANSVGAPIVDRGSAKVRDPRMILIVCNNHLMPTLGEALNQRSDLQKRVAQLGERLRGNVLIQEGDQPAEAPEELLAELGRACDELETLVARINKTNAATTLPSGGTVTEALARRDVLMLRGSALRSAIKEASGRGGLFGRYSRSEIRMVRQVDISALQVQTDALAKARRELDAEIQRHNWMTNLIE